MEFCTAILAYDFLTMTCQEFEVEFFLFVL